jgi:hypothetical protein
MSPANAAAGFTTKCDHTPEAAPEIALQIEAAPCITHKCDGNVCEPALK